VRRQTISELAQCGLLMYSDGYRTKRTELASQGYRIIRVADISDGRVSLQSPDFVSVDRKSEIGDKFGVGGDILLTTKGTVGRVAVMEDSSEPTVYSPQLCYFRVLRPSEINSRYLSYWFESPEFKHQSSYLKGNTDMADYINLRDIGSLSISLPTLSEQNKAVEILGALDSKIVHNQSIAHSIDKLIALQFKSITDDGCLEGKLSDVLQFRYGVALPAATRRPGPFPVYGSGGIVGSHDTSYVPGPGVIVGRKGTIGSVYWSSSDFWPIDTTYYVVPTSPEYSLEYCDAMLRTIPFKSDNNDSAVPGLGRSDALTKVVQIASPGAITDFTRLARTLMRARAALTDESNSLSDIRDQLLPRLLSGTVQIHEAREAIDTSNSGGVSVDLDG
jgi:type I restriction enzyme S subunit